jgi:hypothetical protein
MANNKISKKGTFGTTMGVTSIIAILVVLVLIVFAALSITTSKADLNLSERTAEMTSEYYAADSAAEDMVAEVAEAARGGAGWQERLGDEYSVTEEDGRTVVRYDVPIDENKALSVRLGVAASGDVSRELWQVHSTSEWSGSDDIQLMIE